MTYYNKGVPEVRRDYPLPPYNAPQNPNYSTFANQPQFPLNTGSNAEQVLQQNGAFSYFNGLNQQVAATVSTNVAGTTNIAYPTFKTQGERLLYLQGQTVAAAKARANSTLTVTTIYDIINDPTNY
jgi:hypothetical protein